MGKTRTFRENGKEEWKPASRACSVCGKTQPSDSYGMRCTTECEAVKTEIMRELIRESNRMEAERRAKPATIGDIEDAIKSLRESFSDL